MARRPTVALALRDAQLRDALLSPALQERLAAVADVDLQRVVPDLATLPAEQAARVEVVLTGWGSARIDARALERLPALRLVAHTAGSVKAYVSRAVWRRGVLVTTAASANAVPVVEYTVAMVLLAGKDVLGAAHRYARRASPAPETEGASPAPETEGASPAPETEGASPDGGTRPESAPVVGNYGRVVGVIGASQVGRGVLERLRTFDLTLLLADPTLSADDASELGATLVGLEELMARSDVVTLHAPLLPGTVGMLGAAQLALLRDGATLVNTARGAIVDHAALRRELARGRIRAVLDVTDPEPLEPGDPLFDLPGVLLTPHVAGSQGNELHRMAALAVTEVERFAAGRRPRHPVSLADLDRMA